MIKYIIGFVLLIAVVLVAVTIGANNDQIITFNYVVAQNEIRLSTLVAILFGLGLLLGWLITAFFYLKLKIKNLFLSRQVKHQLALIDELNKNRE
ncbi:LapA family protein [Histophilus somni]|uniref:LapA family protein n=1 Tax=Histophilus somni TaxID=731 RepID=UPI00201F3725|nr:lipopolysaccharide assembly protein LapA domain-containing protein [Histophilus somni]